VWQTTNIFVTNLPMGITEHSLGMFFARHGPVGSVSSEGWHIFTQF
jgi:U2-associated protein SR140